MRKARKNYSPQEKVAILRRHLLDKVSVSRVCVRFQLQPTVFYRWLKQFFDNGAAALRRQTAAPRRPDVRQRRINVLKKQLRARESREAEQKWMISLTQGQFGREEVGRAIVDAVNREDFDSLLTCICNEPLRNRNRAVAILSYYRLIRVSHIARFLGVSHSSVDRWVRKFSQHGCRLLVPFTSEYCT